MLNRRHILGLAASALPLWSNAQDRWPQKPIKIINPGAPGGTNDVLARHIVEPLSRTLGQQVIVESKAGAGGIIGAQYTLQQPADGYTILTHHNGIVTGPLMSAAANYDPLKDFVPLSMQGSSPMLLMVHPAMPTTLAEFVAYARANPGKLEWGTAALGGVGHLATESFNDLVGIKGSVRVAFSGSAPAVQGLVGGQVKYLLTTATSATAGLAQEGRLRLLGVSSPARSVLYPNLPSISEVVPGFAAEAWFGLFAKAGTPASIAAKLTDAIVTALAEPEVVEKYRAVSVVARSGAGELAGTVRREHDLWARVVREKNIRLD